MCHPIAIAVEEILLPLIIETDGHSRCGEVIEPYGRADCSASFIAVLVLAADCKEPLSIGSRGPSFRFAELVPHSDPLFDPQAQLVGLFYFALFEPQARSKDAFGAAQLLDKTRFIAGSFIVATFNCVLTGHVIRQSLVDP